MEILVFKETLQQDDGSSVSHWRAVSTIKDIGGLGATARHAVAGFVRWLKMAVDDDNERVPYLDQMVAMKPDLTWEERKQRGTTYDEIEEYDDPELIELYRDQPQERQLDDGTDVAGPPVKAEVMVPLYNEAPAHIAEKWRKAVAFKDVIVPDGWEVRIFKE